MDGGGENLHMQVMEARKTVVLGPEHPDTKAIQTLVRDCQPSQSKRKKPFLPPKINPSKIACREKRCLDLWAFLACRTHTGCLPVTEERGLLLTKKADKMIQSSKSILLFTASSKWFFHTKSHRFPAPTVQIEMLQL
jgi:hypothetical protein